MQFESFADFIAMGGYGFYVWLAFGFSLVVFFVITLTSLRKHNQLRQEVLKMQDREQRMKQAGESDLL